MDERSRGLTRPAFDPLRCLENSRTLFNIDMSAYIEYRFARVPQLIRRTDRNDRIARLQSCLTLDPAEMFIRTIVRE